MTRRDAQVSRGWAEGLVEPKDAALKRVRDPNQGSCNGDVRERIGSFVSPGPSAVETRLEGGADQFCRDRVVPEAAEGADDDAGL